MYVDSFNGGGKTAFYLVEWSTLLILILDYHSVSNDMHHLDVGWSRARARARARASSVLGLGLELGLIPGPGHQRRRGP